jgi:hypothetical protein
LLYIAASVEQYCDITQVNALPENEGILELCAQDSIMDKVNAFNACDRSSVIRPIDPVTSKETLSSSTIAFGF